MISCTVLHSTPTLHLIDCSSRGLERLVISSCQVLHTVTLNHLIEARECRLNCCHRDPPLPTSSELNICNTFLLYHSPSPCLGIYVYVVQNCKSLHALDKNSPSSHEYLSSPSSIKVHSPDSLSLHISRSATSALKSLLHSHTPPRLFCVQYNILRSCT